MQFHVRFCLPDAPTADAFRERFGGTRLTSSPFKLGRPSGPRVRYQRAYSPRVVDGKIMTPGDLRQLLKCMLEIEKVTVFFCYSEAREQAATGQPSARHASDRCAGKPAIRARDAAPGDELLDGFDGDNLWGAAPLQRSLMNCSRHSGRASTACRGRAP